MQEKSTLERLYKLIIDDHSARKNLDNMIPTTLCMQLRLLHLPKNHTQCLSYLIKEREILIQTISDYQIELQVIVHNTFRLQELI